MKKIFVISVTILLVFLIYLSTIDKKVYFLTLTNEKNNLYNDKIAEYLKKQDLLEKYITEFNGNDLRITDFIKMIESNKTISIKGKEQSIKNALIKADVLVLEVGKVELFTKLAYETDENILYDYIDEISKDLENLLSIIRTYCKEDIHIIKIYNPQNRFSQEVMDYMNEKVKKLSKKYKINYVDYSLQENMTYDVVELNEKGQEQIYRNLKKSLSRTLFSK